MMTSETLNNPVYLSKIKDDQIYKNIVFNRDVDKDMVLGALEIVKMYIVKKKRILVGGMAIDYALRKKGKQLYPDNTLPDYDFFSPQFHQDAYNIANELSRAGFTTISVINAFHASTMRVRVRFHVVADCTYIPENLYDGLPTVKYDAFIIIHPHYQMLNQHLALSRPYSGAPLETVSRWKKDIIRFDILDREYPVENKYELNQINDDSIEFQTWAVDVKDVSDLCLNGFGALLYWFFLAKRDGFSEADCDGELSEYNKLGSVSVSDSTIELKIPAVSMGGAGEIGMSWYCDMREILKHPYVAQMVGGASVRRFNSFLDILPRRYVISGGSGDCEVVDNRGDMVGAHKDILWVVNLQVLLKYFLMNYIVSFNVLKLRNGYRLYLAYRLAYFIVKWACGMYKKDSESMETYLKYLPTHTVFGKHNWHETYIMRRKAFQTTIGKLPREAISIDMPKPAFIDSKEEYPVDPEKYKFDPKRSPIYQFDYMEAREPFDDLFLHDSEVDGEL